MRLYDTLLAEDPSDTATAIERARVMGWAGRLADSEKAYRTVLEKDPASVEASLGLAQTLGWQGRLDESEALYRQSLEKSPSEARLGLARLSLWRGDVGGALRTARAELATDPKNKEALEVEKAALDRTHPSLALASELTDDTDDNRNVSGSAALSFHPGGLVDIDVTAAHLRERGHDLEAQRLDLDPATPGVQSPPGANDLRTLSAEALSIAVGFPAGGRGRIPLSAPGQRLGRYERPAPP